MGVWVCGCVVTSQTQMSGGGGGSGGNTVYLAV